VFPRKDQRRIASSDTGIYGLRIGDRQPRREGNDLADNSPFIRVSKVQLRADLFTPVIKSNLLCRLRIGNNNIRFDAARCIQS
jgi:hypothetical protein